MGKSTLFSRLTKSRDAIVADCRPARDRHYSSGRRGKRTNSSSSTREASSPTHPAASTAGWPSRPTGGGRGRRGDLRCGRAVASRRRTDIAKYLRRLEQTLRAGRQQAEACRTATHLARVHTNWAWAEMHRLGRAWPGRAQYAGGTGAQVLACPARRAGRRRRRDNVALPWRGANVGKSTLISTWLGEKSAWWPSTYRAPRATPSRCPSGAMMAQKFRADRHRGPAPQGQGVRGDREVLRRQDPAEPSSRPTWCCCCSMRPGA